MPNASWARFKDASIEPESLLWIPTRAAKNSTCAAVMTCRVCLSVITAQSSYKRAIVSLMISAVRNDVDSLVIANVSAIDRTCSRRRSCSMRASPCIPSSRIRSDSKSNFNTRSTYCAFWHHSRKKPGTVLIPF